MAKAVNKVFLIGRLTKDVELRSTPSGKQVASATLAVDKGNKDEGTNFFDLTAWDKTAELMSQYTQKGSKLHIEGTLDHQTWEQDGVKRSKVVVIVRDLTFLDSKAESNQNQSQSGDTVPTNVSAETEIDLDSIPF